MDGKSTFHVFTCYPALWPWTAKVFVNRLAAGQVYCKTIIGNFLGSRDAHTATAILFHSNPRVQALYQTVSFAVAVYQALLRGEGREDFRWGRSLCRRHALLGGVLRYDHTKNPRRRLYIKRLWPC